MIIRAKVTFVIAMVIGVVGCVSSKWFRSENATQYCIIDLTEGPDAKRYPVSFSECLPRGDEYKCSKIVLKKIPAGKFKMCGKGEVRISKPFYIGVYHVTEGQLLKIAGSWNVPLDKSAYSGKHDSCTALYLTYDDLRGRKLGSRWPASSEVDPESVIGKLRARTGLKGLDLPTEAQWEYACRAGCANHYHSGGDTVDHLNRIGNWKGNPIKKSVVGSYEPNAWGLYDMQGSAYQWCLDWGPWAIVPCADPKGNETGSCRCLRGGCFAYRADECRADFRYYDYGRPSNSSAYFGFRLCCPADEIEAL